MKHSQKVAFSAIMSALTVAIMIISRMFSYFEYTLPALAGALLLLVVIEVGVKWAFASFLVTALLSVFFASPESSAIFIAYIGYYPIVKAFAEKRKSRLLSWAIKLVGFNITIVAAYSVINLLVGPLEGFSDFGKYSALILLLIANVAFVIYDIGLTRAITVYMHRYHDKIRRTFK